jgi:hypothetical protein
LLTLFIGIGIGLGTLTALAFSTQATKKFYLAHYNFTLSNESFIRTNSEEVVLDAHHNSSLSLDKIYQITKQLSNPYGANITILNLEYRSTYQRCFADTSIISETIREILKSTSNKVFYTLIGIVTIFYSITFVLALRRQNPRIRALKKSLNVLNKFDSYPSSRPNQQPVASTISIRPPSCSSITATTSLTKQTVTTLNESNPSDDNLLLTQTQTETNTNEQQYEMSNFLNRDDSEDQNLPSPTILRKTKKSQNDISISEGTSDDLQPSSDKLNGTKQVSFQIQNRHNTLMTEQNQHLSLSTASIDGDLDISTDMYYKLPCPCSTTRQLLIKFHFARPSFPLSKWLCCCCCCCIKKESPISNDTSIASQTEDEAVTILTPTVQSNPTSISNSDTLRRQLHRHRIQQLRMASTFLIITVSFVLFYLPSILNAERIIKSPIMIYYLFLCTHALNPVIYCFMNPSLRAYVISMFRCPVREKHRNTTGGKTSFMER